MNGNGAGRATRNARRGIFRLALVAAMLPLIGGCEWFTTFKDQPRIEPWEAEYQGANVGFRGNPANSVPIAGGGVPEFEIGLGRFPTVFPAVIDSFAGMTNPVPATEASIEMGRKYYQINCAICHGAAGAGNGVMLQYGVAAPSLTNERGVGLSDGYYYGMIRNGRGSMPNYARIPHMHRWDVVNYIRALQAGGAVDTAAVGVPGETGPRLPGASMTAPTLPSPYLKPADAFGASGATAAAGHAPAADTAAPAQPNAAEVRP